MSAGKREPRDACTDGVVALSHFAPSDAAAMCEADRDPEHRRRFATPADFVPSVEHSRAVVARWQAERAAGSRFVYAVRAARGGELLGGCELAPLGDGALNLAYWTYVAHRRRGVASRAVALVLPLAFEDLAATRVEASIDADNEASRRVAMRAGLTEVGARDGRRAYALARNAEARHLRRT
jgi:RimJ/RimL family protein N-acetyltransferase